MPKLVRDNIPQIIKKDNCTAITHIASDAEYYSALKEKLGEEFKEYFESENPDEMADILEVLYAICDYKQLDLKEVEKLRTDKAKKRGAFKKRIILDKIE